MSVLVGKEAPNFKAKCVVKGQCKDIQLKDYKGKYVVLFFYPLDFTFVCPTELHAFQSCLKEFSDNNCVVLGCSVDSHFSRYHAVKIKNNYFQHRCIITLHPGLLQQSPQADAGPSSKAWFCAHRGASSQSSCPHRTNRRYGSSWRFPQRSRRPLYRIHALRLWAPTTCRPLPASCACR